MNKFKGIHWSKMPNREAIIKKIALKMKGQPSSRKGISLSEDHKNKISESMKKLPAEFYIKIGLKQRGKKLSLNHKEKLRIARLGKKLSEEIKQKIGNAHRGIPETQEAIKKVTEARVKKSSWVRNFGVNGRLATKLKATKPELRLFNILKNLQISFYPDYLMYNKFFVDAYLPKQNIILEVDGRYWHSSDKQKEKDRKKDLYLTACGHQVYRFWEDTFNQQSIQNLLLKGGE